jgi:ring-1,2-phenylacetyl-CoA epoxidase subunit PaaC
LTYTNELNSAIYEYAVRHGDDRLILGHRLAEWCSHAPILEEDIALTNISLDLLGQSIQFLKYACEVENKGRTEDDLAYKRSEREFKNLLITEQANENFAYSICRQFYYDVYDYYFYEELSKSKDERLAAIASKSIKETKYHLRHSSNWMLRLGDGTELSNKKLKEAVDFLWMYTGEMFTPDNIDELLLSESFGVDLKLIKPKWIDSVFEIKKKAKIDLPDVNAFMQYGGRKGLHTENLGHILAEMQYLQNAYPDANW